ncbi:trypsin-like serine peptidase [Kiloniella laminariae]|uniref:trypsin-like serine peptidase n=1 Tax=Kiloniella laminariae TaxID=454162 RepID=UPI0003620580|nr:trypsin-like serine protease [Kiloniella laminariae]
MSWQLPFNVPREKPAPAFPSGTFAFVHRPTNAPVSTKLLLLLWFVSLLLCTTISPGQAAGKEQRILVNAMEYPWSTLGRVNAAGRAHCTGVMVSERHVLTAAHCIYDVRTGRWLAPQELHFVAGYQFSTYEIHAPVKSYRKSANYRPLNEASARNTETDWALLELASPLGKQTGWLALETLSNSILQRIKQGQSVLLSSGYRAGAPHAQTVDFNCQFPGRIKNSDGIAHRCFLQNGDSGSPLLLYDQGEFSIVGINVVGFSSDNGRSNEYVGALTSSRFHPERGSKDVKQAIGKLAFLWDKGALPGNGSKAGKMPGKTIALLLEHLGYLSKAEAASDPAVLQAALQKFYKKRDKPAPAQTNYQVLGDLILTLK